MPKAFFPRLFQTQKGLKKAYKGKRVNIIANFGKIAMVERVKTGIEGLDELLQGGIPTSSSFLIPGGAGTGKTIFAMQYIYNGALQYNEPGIYVTLETNLKNITWNMQSFNWDIKKMQDKNLMRTYRLNLSYSKNYEEIEEKIDNELAVIAELVEEIGAKRLAIDSVASFGLWIERRGLLRNLLYRFTDKLKDLGCTTLLTTETGGERREFSQFGVEEFIVDGVISLYFVPPNRAIFVKKMRGTDHSKNIHPFEITPRGISVKSKDRILWESIK